MRKQLFLDIQERLASLLDGEGNRVIKHIDLWNRQVDFLEEETPFPYPAVFVEFLPHQWEQKGRGQQQATVRIRLHIVTRWFAQTAEYAPGQDAALDFLDLPETIMAHIHRLTATQSNAFVRVGSTTNHDHAHILDSIEEYETRIFSNAAVPDYQAVTPELKVFKDVAPEL